MLTLGAALAVAVPGPSRADTGPSGWGDGFLLDRGQCGATLVALDGVLIEQCLRDAGRQQVQVYSTFSNTGLTPARVQLNYAQVRFVGPTGIGGGLDVSHCTSAHDLPPLSGITCTSSPLTVPGQYIHAQVEFSVLQDGAAPYVTRQDSAQIVDLTAAA